MSLVFGKYEKIRRIAQGGMGEVFLARQTGVLDRLAILKSLRHDLAQEKEFVDQFTDEARVAATLNHPNIVSIYDVGEWNGTHYIAMEYVPGEDLSKLWYAAAKAGVGLPFQVSVRICYEAALGLDHAHKAKDVRGNPLNIVHRDVSPQNIMVRGDGVVKLVDFGIAKAANKSSRTQAGMVKGKLQYMSPEQVRGEALDGRSDQFSLGVVLWEMCTGRRLFKAENEVQTLQKILQSPIPKPSQHVPGFPVELEAAIMKMLQRDADNRFRTTGDVAADLKSYIDRAGIANGEISVAGFVQQILGKELEERTRDLTPMEVTEAAAPLPKRPPPKDSGGVSGARANVAAQSSRNQLRVDDVAAADMRADGGKVAPNDRSTAVLDADALPNRIRGEVRTKQGSLRFDDHGVLRQWILDGQVVAEDSFTIDGNSWKKVRDAKELAKFLEIAAATRDVSESRPAAPRPDPLAGMPAPPVGTPLGARPPAHLSGGVGPTGTSPSMPIPVGAVPVDPAPSVNTVTRPVAAVDPNNPQTLSLSLGPNDKTDGQHDAFSLGDLPSSKTGTWGAPDIAMLAKAQAARDAQTPATLDTRAPAPTARAPTRVPTIVWIAAGVVGALVVLGGGLAIVAPDLFGGGMQSANVEVEKALAAAKNDDAAVIDALLAALEPQAAKAAARGDADRTAAAALLHVSRARVDAQAKRLASMLAAATGDAKDGKGGKDAPKAPAVVADPDKHRVAAYKLATKASALDDKSASAALAMALYQAERGAGAELATDAARATKLANKGAFAAVVASELAVAKDMLEAQALLEKPLDAAKLRNAAGALDGVADDTRAQHVALVLRLAAAASADETAAADLDLAVTEIDKLTQAGATDPRAAVAAALAKALEAKVKAAGKPVKPPDGAKVDAGPAVARDAGPTTAIVKADAGPAVTPAVTKQDAGPATVAAKGDAGPVAVVDAGPPETYEQAIARAQAAHKRGSMKTAAGAYQVALKLKPDDVKAQLGLGWVYIDLGRHDGAAQQFQRIITKEPNRAEAYMGLGEALRAQGKTEDAKAAFQKYLEIAPDGPDHTAAENAIRQLE